MEPTKEQIDQSLAEWREANWGELDACLKVARSIRDNEKASPRDRNEAIKSIARLLGAFSTKPSDSARQGQPARKKGNPDEMGTDEVAEVVGLISDPR